MTNELSKKEKSTINEAKFLRLIYPNVSLQRKGCEFSSCQNYGFLTSPDY